MLSLLVASWLIASNTGGSHQDGRPVYESTSVVGDAPEIDGRLNDAAWSTAPWATQSVERRPEPGAEPPVITQFKVIHNSGNLFIAAEMFIPSRDSIVARELRHDHFLIWADDAVTIKIDPRRDQRTTYGFAVSALGARLDYIALDNGRIFRVEHDALWEAEAQVLEDRWTVEVRIPFSALGTRPTADRPMGFNFTRDHNSANATYDWAPLPPEFGAVAALYYGELHGVDGDSGGRLLKAQPFALGTWRSPFEKSDGRIRGGGDLLVQLGEDIWAETTALTDFAQVDLDDAVVNLDRFPLFLPEKRPFFINGLDVFDFGASGESQPFFSRRIGRNDDGEEVPLWWGGKIYGHSDSLRFGAIDVVTAGEQGGPATNWSVLRAQLSPEEDRRLGFIFVGKHNLGENPNRSTDGHSSVGVDSKLRLGERLEVSSFGTASMASQRPPRFSGGANATWRGSYLQPTASVLAVEEGFAPPAGFVRRDDVLNMRVRVPLIVRGLGGAWDYWEASATTTHQQSLRSKRFLSRSLEASSTLAAVAGFTGTINGSTWSDEVESDFELVPGVQVPAGRYAGSAVGGVFRVSAVRNPSGHLAYSYNTGFFGGNAHTLNVGMTASLTAHLRLNAGIIRTFFKVPQGAAFAGGARVAKRQTTAINTNLVFAWSPDLSLEIIGRYEDVNESAVGTARVRWLPAPTLEIFAFYRQDRSKDVTPEHQVGIKLQGTFQTAW